MANQPNLTLQAAHRARRIPNGENASYWAEVLRGGGGVSLCLSPELAKAWSEGLASGLGARAVYLGPEIVAAIVEANSG